MAIQSGGLPKEKTRELSARELTAMKKRLCFPSHRCKKINDMMLTFNSIFCICYIACWSLRQALSFIVLENLNISKSINVFAFLTRVNSEKTE